MALQELLEKPELTVVGLNSGTSADGLDLAAVRFSGGPESPTIEVLRGQTKRFDSDLKEIILRVADSPRTSLTELIYLDNMLGDFFGRSAAAFIKKLDKDGIATDAVASHGQTIRHVPSKTQVGRYRVHGTLQVGSPEFVAAHTGKVVVADFRQADIALGGEGAPITVEAMRRLFASPTESRLIVNIGGMANYFYFPAGRGYEECRAADCGPGNVLSDLLATRLLGDPYDKGGRRARAGTSSARLLSVLMSHRFFTSRLVSTGREDFGPGMIDRMQAFQQEFDIENDDLFATAAEVTVRGIVTKVKPIINGDERISKFYLTGGGANNSYFVKRLREELDGLPVTTVKDLGVAPELVEAVAYAVIGHAALRSEAYPTGYGGKVKQSRLPVLGRIVQPPKDAS